MGTPEAPDEFRTVRYCAREFTPSEIADIRAVIASGEHPTRAAVAREVCRRLNWRKPDDGLKQSSCRTALSRMERDGLLRLPPRMRGQSRAYTPTRTAAGDPGPLLEGPRGDLGRLRIVRVRPGDDSHLWNEVIARHHYLGYRPLVGAQLRYLVYAEQRLLAALGFAAAAWRVLDRDDFIGWNDAQRVARLHLIVNNSRFLIMPSVRVRMLASSLLAQVTRQLPADWESAYGYRPVLLESFVECDRFSGTSYRGANWTFIGETTGRGKFDRYKTNIKIFKSIWIYPLHRRFRETLSAPLAAPPQWGGRP